MGVFTPQTGRCYVSELLLPLHSPPVSRVTSMLLVTILQDPNEEPVQQIKHKGQKTERSGFNGIIAY
jgi:hypothetical protein